VVSYAPFNATEITQLNELKLLRTLCEQPVDAALSGCGIAARVAIGPVKPASIRRCKTRFG